MYKPKKGVLKAIQKRHQDSPNTSSNNQNNEDRLTNNGKDGTKENSSINSFFADVSNKFVHGREPKPSLSSLAADAYEDSLTNQGNNNPSKISPFFGKYAKNRETGSSPQEHNPLANSREHSASNHQLESDVQGAKLSNPNANLHQNQVTGQDSNPELVKNPEFFASSSTQAYASSASTGGTNNRSSMGQYSKFLHENQMYFERMYQGTLHNHRDNSKPYSQKAKDRYTGLPK